MNGITTPMLPPPQSNDVCICGHSLDEHSGSDYECVHRDPDTHIYCWCDAFMRPSPVEDLV